MQACATRFVQACVQEGSCTRMFEKGRASVCARKFVQANTRRFVLDDAERPEEKETIKRWSDFLEVRNLQYHKVGKKEIATFRVNPINRKSEGMVEVKTHSRSNIFKLFITNRRRKF